jgi:tetratricopeptide (TPR) repeat protein
LGADYLELLNLIEGHPLAMQIALPMLDSTPASVVTGELSKRIADMPEQANEEGRDGFLTAVMDYSFSRMSHRSRVHLPFLSLFQRRVMMDVLTHITQERPYRTVMGEELGWGACRTLLRSARDAGFLEPITPSVYQINPAFPWFYGRGLHQQVRQAGVRDLEREFVRVYADTADYFLETLYENQDSGATAVLAEEGNLTQALGLALEDQQWDTAQVLVQPLAQVYRMQKRYPELRRLRRQLVETLAPESGAAEEAKERGGIELWLYLMGTEASEATDLGDLDRSEELNGLLLTYLESQPEGDQDPRTASVYHQFGVIAQSRWQLELAEEWFQKSVAIIESGEDRESVADDYYCLGQVRLHQRLYTEAKDWYSKALDIHQRLEDQEELVKDYRALGLAAQFRFEHDEAESWYQRARAILEENRDEETAILVYHELGTVYLSRYDYEEADRWYMQALHLSDQLGKPEQMAVEFHYLGLMEQSRGLFFDDAENWFQMARQKREELGDNKGVGDESRQLGVLFHEQKKLEQAEEWYRDALDIFQRLEDVQRVSRTLGQLAMVEEERGNLAASLEWAHRVYLLALDHDLPVLIQVRSHLARLRDAFGQEAFAEWWRGSTGGDPPTDLDVDTSTIL